MLKLFQAKPRKPRIEQFYSHLYWDERIAPVFQEQLAQARARGASIATVASVTSKCWKAESDEFKAEVEATMAKLYAGQLRDWDDLVNKHDGVAIDPKERAQ
jgi:hypothetical protein